MKKINDLAVEFPQCFHKHFSPDNCGDGWYELVRDFVVHLASHNTNRRNESKREWEKNAKLLREGLGEDTPVTPWQEIGWIQISTIKEKFGALRIYTEGGDQYTWGLANMAEAASCSMCEECGSNQNLVVCQPWIRNLCEPCANLWKAKQAERGAREVTYRRKENAWDSPMSMGGYDGFGEIREKMRLAEIAEYTAWKAEQDAATAEQDAADGWWSSLGHEQRTVFKEKYGMEPAYVADEVMRAWTGEGRPERLPSKEYRKPDRSIS